MASTCGGNLPVEHPADIDVADGQPGLPAESPTLTQRNVVDRLQAEMLNDVLDHPDLSSENAELLKRRNKVCILVTGKTKAGKSTLINSFFGGEEKARVGEGITPQTSKVEPYYFEEKNNVYMLLFDSPGFESGSKNKNWDYICGIKKAIERESKSTVDLVFFCVRMTDYKIGDDDLKAMTNLTNAFGQDIWLSLIHI